MTTLISAQNLHLDTADGALFQDLSFTLSSGDRVGLMGHNGCGKSTLLSLLCGHTTPDQGNIQMAHACRLQRVEQHLPPALHTQSARQALQHAVADPAEYWRVDATLAELGLPPQLADLPVSALSGGQHTRLLLGRALLQAPNVLLLDEPGNHLDLPSLLWLERFLQGWRGAFIVVSHDPRLLDNVTQASWILRDQRLYRFELPCSAARLALAEADAAARSRHAAEQAEIDRLSASGKQLALWGRTYDNEGLSRKARVIEQRVERLRAGQTFVSRGAPWVLALQGEALSGRQLLRLDEADVSPAPGLPPLFRSRELQVRSGDRIALLGVNGSGKSTLLRRFWQALQGQEQTDGARFHAAASVGYYDQALRQLDDHATLDEALRPFCRLSDTERRHALIRIGFAYARHGQRVATLSGGERSRLMFLALSLARHHLLLLDEPTNHLDMEGKDELAAVLARYAGAFVLVSHERSLVEASCNRFWLIADGRLEEWPDADSAWRRIADGAGLGQPATGPTAAAPGVTPATDDDALLARLLKLESALAADLARKPRHQKPQLHEAWRGEIAVLSQVLGL